LCFFVLIWAHFLDCNIVKTYWCLKCYMYRNCWQFYWILNEKCNRENISFILLNNYNVAVVTLLLLCCLQSVTREKCCSKTWSCYDFDILRCWRWNKCKLYMRKSFLYIVTKQRDHWSNWFRNKEKLILLTFCMLFIIEQSWITVYLNVTNLKYCTRSSV